ncbi:MAG: hypothetical protein M9950_08685 [Thermomicrobiales bacterium]|nr:hypothetical protein [Thermomicrobiales bacterium]MCO5218318.1 hypothetical protein [Thermomicrobiales bacterium]
MAQQAFDPSVYLSKVKGQDYLEVKWRIAWMRHEHPDARLDTELISHDHGRAIMRARVEIPGGGIASGWGSETETNFENYIEKAETKAIGRALTALGYGTPGSAENDDDGIPLAAVQHLTPANEATPPQRARIKHLADEVGLDPVSLNALVQQHTGTGFDQMNKRQASGMIDLLEARLQGRSKAS